MRKLMPIMIALFSACAPVTTGESESPTPEPSVETDTIVEYFEISKVFKVFVPETGFSYYTVYAVNLETGETQCIADDVGEDVMPEFEWLITVGQRIAQVYEAGQPSYTGMLYPIE